MKLTVLQNMIFLKNSVYSIKHFPKKNYAVGVEILPKIRKITLLVSRFFQKYQNIILYYFLTR